MMSGCSAAAWRDERADRKSHEEDTTEQESRSFIRPPSALVPRPPIYKNGAEVANICGTAAGKRYAS